MKVRIPSQIITGFILGGTFVIPYLFWADVIALAKAFGEWIAGQ